MKKKIRGNILNIGTGKDFTIKQYLNILLKISGIKKTKILFDRSKTNGTPRKVLDISLAKKHGWKAKFDLRDSLELAFNAYSELRKNEIKKKI